MINPLQLGLVKDDGTRRNIIIEPILEKRDKKLHSTGIYKIYKDISGEETTLFTEPLETLEPNTDIPDYKNPDYLGKIIIDMQANWTYTGDILSVNEQ